jgi:signal peptidase I
MSDFIKQLVIDIIIAALIAAAVLFFVRPMIVEQTSMESTLEPNNIVIMYKRAYTGDKTPERGDIVIFKSKLKDDKGRDKLLIKRVIGLPGDTITIKDDQLYINGKEYDEDYLKDGITTGEIDSLKIPKGKYFMMGDNRVVSVDSRYSEVGLIDESDIQGKVVLRIWPITQIKRL